MKRMLVVFPTDWDAKQLAACRSHWEARYEIIYAQPADVDCPADFDIFEFIDRMVEQHRGAIDGVFSSSDYPGATAAAAIAAQLELPGPRATAVLRSSHKYYSRLVQQEAVPSATPWFQIVDPNASETELETLHFPCFVKPVKGAFSIMTRRVERAAQLHQFLQQPEVREFLNDYVDIFDRLVNRLTNFEFGGRYFLAEQLLSGVQVTVEGWVQKRQVHILGVVDSILHSHVPSFARFVYPSRLEPEVQNRMSQISIEVIEHLGLNDTLFNIELIYNESEDSLSIIEVNPRICGQFGDLYQKVDGVNSYELVLAVAAGEPVEWQFGRGQYAVAASVPWRVFQPSKVVSAPTAAQIEAVEREFAGVLFWSECAAGDSLCQFQDEDSSSQRYAVLNLGAANGTQLDRRIAVLEERLKYEFEAVEEEGE